MFLADVLREKGTRVLTVRPQAALDDAVAELVRHNVGSLVVCDAAGEGFESRMVGIVTERDVLRAMAAHGAEVGKLRVEDVMTRDVVTGSPTSAVPEIMGVMTQQRIRHLPVVDGGRLVGIVSIGDLVKAEHDQYAMENHYLKSYLHS